MRIAGKINLLITALAITAGAILVFFIAQREYAYKEDELILKASTEVASQPHLQMTLYFRGEREIDAALDEFLALSPAVRYVALRESLGDVIARRDRPWAAGATLPRFSAARDGVPPLEQSLLRYESPLTPPGFERVAPVLDGETVTSVALPVTSVANPTAPGLSRDDFGRALANPQDVGSIFVSGYVEIGISTLTLWAKVLPSIAVSGGVGLIFVAICALAAAFGTRRITAPLGRLAAVADDIAAGKQTDLLRVRGSGEISDIANVLNTVIAGMDSEKKRMHTDHRLMTMKVSERDAQLTERQQELEQARQRVGETRDRLRHMAYFDPLTSLPNRRLFTEQLQLLLRLAARNKQMVALLLLDLDNFKRVNESLGHHAGDLLLREVGDRLASCIRESDVLHRNPTATVDSQERMDLSRMGGDEFTVVLNQLEDLAGASAVAERLASALSAPYSLDGEEVIVTCSIGIAVAPQHGDDVEALLSAAGTAMFNAKQDGRNRFLFYAEHMEGSNREQLKLETELRKAAGRDQLLLHYQPQVDSRTGEVVGAEALVRWEHPEFGLVPPFKWIPLAEELGLIDEVGEWVLHRACRDLVGLRDSGLVLPTVSVNVSALQFTDRFTDQVARALAETGLPPASLIIELTEGVMLRSEDGALRIVEDLKALGVRTSIDDFGTGYSSLSYLSQLPLDELKVDRSFVVRLGDGERHRELVRGIIAMAKSLHMATVVEGVESPEELTFFQAEGAHVLQGYLFSAPLPEGKLRAALEPDFFARQLRRMQKRPDDDGFHLEEA